jgi:hypothetical protein
MILGDSLLVMTSLAEKEGLKGKVQMIYFDPPYGIKFGSNWQVSTRKRDVKDGKVEDATRQPEQIRAFRDTWKLGVHSYLAYLRDRLTVARELLTETGSVFVQIGDENVHLVRNVLDEVFGSEHFVSLISIRKLTGVDSTLLPSTTDFVLFYAKDIEQTKFRHLLLERLDLDEGSSRYDQLLLPDGTRRALTPNEKAGVEAHPAGGAFNWPHSPVTSSGRTQPSRSRSRVDGTIPARVPTGKRQSMGSARSLAPAASRRPRVERFAIAACWTTFLRPKSATSGMTSAAPFRVAVIPRSTSFRLPPR